MTTPHPHQHITYNRAPTFSASAPAAQERVGDQPQLITCPGCGKAHAKHSDLGVWCTAACATARMREPIAADQSICDVTIEPGRPAHKPARQRRPHP